MFRPEVLEHRSHLVGQLREHAKDTEEGIQDPPWHHPNREPRLARHLCDDCKFSSSVITLLEKGWPTNLADEIRNFSLGQRGTRPTDIDGLVDEVTLGRQRGGHQIVGQVSSVTIRPLGKICIPEAQHAARLGVLSDEVYFLRDRDQCDKVSLFLLK